MHFCDALCKLKLYCEFSRQNSDVFLGKSFYVAIHKTQTKIGPKVGPNRPQSWPNTLQQNLLYLAYLKSKSLLFFTNFEIAKPVWNFCYLLQLVTLLVCSYFVSAKNKSKVRYVSTERIFQNKDNFLIVFYTLYFQSVGVDEIS